MTTDFDDLVIGAGMAGLSVAALLARSGRRVLVLEAHDVPGGYAHTFTVRKHRFCAQVHYIFACGEGETIHRLLDTLGVAERVPFVRLDPEGFDHVVVGDVRVRIPNGLAKFRERLVRRFPDAERPLTRYFHEVAAVAEELARLPSRITPWVAICSAHRHWRLLRYLKWTLADFYDHVGMPPLLRAVLAGQSGDYLLPPRDVSFLLHVALVEGYDRGAYYPERHFFHFVDTIADVVRTSPGCQLLLEHEVERIDVEGSRVASVTTRNGRTFTAKRYLSNVDPRRTVELAGARGRGAFARDRRRLDYDYSCGTFTLYLALRELDLREHGFGSFNVWHYPHADIDRMYDDQLVRNDLSSPWLFMSTPTLHSHAPGLCPPGEQILEIATALDHTRYERLRREDRREYNRAKKRLVDTVLDLVEARYVPRLREHLTMRIAGTPATNERFCRAPHGNSYGSSLVPANVRPGRGPYRTALDNLWMANATAGFPSVAGAIGAGMRLYEELSS